MRLVSSDEAVWLKDHGYDGRYYDVINPVTDRVRNAFSRTPSAGCIPAPRVDDVANWLRDNFGLHVSADLLLTWERACDGELGPVDHHAYKPTVVSLGTGDYRQGEETHDYEEALHMAVRIALHYIRERTAI